MVCQKHSERSKHKPKPLQHSHLPIYTVLLSAEHTYNDIIDSNNHSATISILDRSIMQSPKILLSKSTLERTTWVCSEELNSWIGFYYCLWAGTRARLDQLGSLIWIRIAIAIHMIIRLEVVLKRTVVGDWRFDNLNGSHLQSQVNNGPDW